jgi:thiol-disulfide isomerase/thioredoxin
MLKRNIIIGLIAFIVGFGATFYAIKSFSQKPIITKITIKGFETLRDTVTKPTVVHLWFSYCTGCVKGLPELKEFCKKNNIQLVHISSDKSDSKMQENLEKISKQYELTNNFIVDDTDLYPTKPKSRLLVGDYCDKVGLNFTKNPGAPYFALLDKKGNVEKEFNSFENFKNFYNLKP